MILRRATGVLFVVGIAAGWLACVGTDPAASSAVTSDGGANADDASGSTDAPPSDTGSDARPTAACDPKKPFGPKVPVSGLLQGGAVARLSQDELEIYYADFSGMFTDAGQSDIVVAKRTKRTDAFGTPTSVGAINTAAREEQPSITGDGNTLFFLRDTSGFHIYSSTRGDGGLFGATTSEVPVINQAGAFDGNVYVGPSGQWLYFQSDRDGGGHIWRAARGDAGTFETPKKLAELASPGAGEGEGSPVLTPDELVMYFASNRKDLGGSGSADMYMATRTDTAQAFGNIVRIDESSLATGGEETPTWISPDNCRLYLTYRADTSSPTAIYVTTRGK